MDSIIYIKSLHRPYNQNLNSVKWVCKFIKDTNSNYESSRSDFYFEFYVYLIKKLYNLYKKNPNGSLTHGIPSFDSVRKTYESINGLSKERKKKIIYDSLAKRNNEFEKSIFNTYKATSYFINLAKDKLRFVDQDFRLTNIGASLLGLRSNEFKLSQKEKEVLFCAIVRNDFHFFISLALLQRILRNVKNLSVDEIHFEFLVESFNVRHFSYTEASNEKNFSKIREHWINDLGFLDRNLNIKKSFLLVLNREGLGESYSRIKIQVEDYYKQKIISKSRIMAKIDFFLKVYQSLNQNELGFVPLKEIADKMKMGKKTFQIFLSEFYELEKNRYHIFFNNVVQVISGSNQYFIRNRPVVNIRIKEFSK